MFFSLQNIESTLKQLSISLTNFQEKTNESEVAFLVIYMLNFVISNSEEFDKLCTENIEWIGKSFIDEAQSFTTFSFNDKSRSILDLLIYLYRFICEYDFKSPDLKSRDIARINEVLDKIFLNLPDSTKQNIIYARFTLPVHIARKYYNNPAFQEFQEISKAINEASLVKAEWDQELEARKDHVDSLREELQELTSTYNFVALVNGFQHLARKKIDEQKFAFYSLIAFAFLMIAFPCVYIYFVLSNSDSIEEKKKVIIYILPTIIAIEVILLFFFRIVLHQYRSVKAQMLQLELRIALCQFVESYAEYSLKIKNNNPDSLSRFESVIFNHLVPDGNNIPTTFDGLDQLSNLIKSLKSK